MSFYTTNIIENLSRNQHQPRVLRWLQRSSRIAHFACLPFKSTRSEAIARLFTLFYWCTLYWWINKNSIKYKNKSHLWISAVWTTFAYDRSLCSVIASRVMRVPKVNAWMTDEWECAHARTLIAHGCVDEWWLLFWRCVLLVCSRVNNLWAVAILGFWFVVWWSYY